MSSTTGSGLNRSSSPSRSSAPTLAVRAIRAERPVPVIVITGYQDRNHKERARKEGVAAYLLKPVKRADLEEALARILQGI